MVRPEGDYMPMLQAIMPTVMENIRAKERNSFGL